MELNESYPYFIQPIFLANVKCRLLVTYRYFEQLLQCVHRFTDDSKYCVMNYLKAAMKHLLLTMVDYFQID